MMIDCITGDDSPMLFEVIEDKEVRDDCTRGDVEGLEYTVLESCVETPVLERASEDVLEAKLNEEVYVIPLEIIGANDELLDNCVRDKVEALSVAVLESWDRALVEERASREVVTEDLREKE